MKHCELSNEPTMGKSKGKAILLQAWTGPEGSRRFRLSEFKTIVNLDFTIPECLQNSMKWFLPVKHTFYFVLNALFGQHVSTLY
jgi:hypothetical protein